MASIDNLTAIDEFLRQLKDLHSAPRAASRILQLTSNEDYDIQEVVACLDSDPALTARVLQLVNSARFGLQRSVTNLRQAVMMLGQRTLRLVTISFSLVDGLTKGVGAQAYRDYWKRSLTLATVASRLAESRRDLDKNDAYTAGLLSDVGILVFAQLLKERYAPLLLQCGHSQELIVRERQAFGFAHPALGARLLERWKFPEELVWTAEHHHLTLADADPLQETVRAADLFADILWRLPSPHFAAVRAYLQEHFNLDTDGMINLALGTKEDVESQAKLFRIELDETIDCQSLLETARQQQFSAAVETAMDLDSVAAAFEDQSV